jgi:phospholipid transport system substrate-binding protein
MIHMSVKSLFISLFSLSLLLGVGQVKAVETGATTQVKAVLDGAMDVQTRPDLQGDNHHKERAQLIRKIISENFLSGEMAKESIKGYWDRISHNQQAEFQKLFTILFQDSYTRMVLDFLHKETIEYKPETRDNGSVQVPTLIMRANEHIPVNYAMEQKNGRWFIRDVEIDGVSIVENYRNTFRRVIATGSFDTLLQKMRLQSKAVD